MNLYVFCMYLCNCLSVIPSYWLKIWTVDFILSAQQASKNFCILQESVRPEIMMESISMANSWVLRQKILVLDLPCLLNELPDSKCYLIFFFYHTALLHKIIVTKVTWCVFILWIFYDADNLSHCRK